MSAQAPRMIRRIDIDEITRAVRSPVSDKVLTQAGEIIERVRTGRDDAVRGYAERFGERAPGGPLVLGREEMRRALGSVDPDVRALLERTRDRIETFARAQRDAIGAVEVTVPGGRAGHTVEPVEAAGCYAPGGRYPLPSSVLMTAVTARVAGCARVVVASPGADPLMLAAAAVADADEFLAVGGAHAVAAMAYGLDCLESCDVVVGPGNAWVTAAKQLVSGVVGIDMLAGPSELLVVADETADPALVAADLLAQAEHDTDAIPMLVTTSARLADMVDSELGRQLGELDTRETAEEALRNGFACVVRTIEEACAAADRIGAEHLEVMTRDARTVGARIRNAGALFIGPASAEVFGDYGAGPNHTLPTGGTARFSAGLSVIHFLRLRTWLEIDDPGAGGELARDAAKLARLEGLPGHRASAMARASGSSSADR